MVEKNNTQKILEYFFDCPTMSIHLRELSRQMELSMPAILAGIKKLAKEQLITITKGKALTTVTANAESPFFTRLKKVSNLEKLYTSGLVDEIIKNANVPQAIVCFGSYARGEDTEDSDIDIAIIGGKNSKALDKFEKCLKRKISFHYVPMGTISNEFKSNLCNGIVLEGAL